MKLNRCSVCGSFPYISKSFSTSFELYESQVKCRCCYNEGESFYSADSETCVNAAVDDWNDNFSIEPERIADFPSSTLRIKRGV
jgi:hypothetical protein